MPLSHEEEVESAKNFDIVLKDIVRLKEIFAQRAKGGELPREELHHLKDKYSKAESTPFFHDEKESTKKPIGEPATMVMVINLINELDPNDLKKKKEGAASSIVDLATHYLKYLHEEVREQRIRVTGIPEIEELSGIEIKLTEERKSAPKPKPAEPSIDVREHILDFINKSEKNVKPEKNFKHYQIITAVKEGAEELMNNRIDYAKFKEIVDKAIADYCHYEQSRGLFGPKQDLPIQKFEDRGQYPKNVVEHILLLTRNTVNSQLGLGHKLPKKQS